ncbi:ABC transporter permease [Phototrophicus methaneseepsis]|uniref:ABC transporter permease n=1 Tax=Phototrophicus methaneseepsis TaxID=2710758 RepID=A0A7S8E6E7_9CHLR|nr:ABC transporter permease [Phototrophicus methaneseepsis]QPC81236.1 ABC transporter permease [Phototrophicus methaneseepsis]
MPNTEHILGTDYLGRDVWSRLLYGGRYTLGGAFISTLLAVVTGSTLGLISVSSNSYFNQAILAVIHAVLAIPGLLLALTVLTLMGQGSLALYFAVGIAQVAPIALVVRSASQQIGVTDYVLAAHAMGSTRTAVLRRHILRGIWSVLRAYGLVVFSYAIMNGAALSFLGFGDPGQPDWGIMLSEGRNSFRVASWPAIAPGLAIVVTLMLMNRLADRLPR